MAEATNGTEHKYYGDQLHPSPDGLKKMHDLLHRQEITQWITVEKSPPHNFSPESGRKWVVVIAEIRDD